MKSLEILNSLLQDVSRTLGTDMSRDWITIQTRFQHEGYSFLTITLPAYSTWLEQSLEEGKMLPTIFSRFKRRGHSVGPCFLQGLTKHVFSYDTGDLLETADPSSVFFIRSICALFKKIKLPCSDARNVRSIMKFVDTDRTLPDKVELNNIERSVAHVVLRSLKIFEYDDSLPKHGKGATFERILGNQKYRVRDFYQRWNDVINPEDLYGFYRGEGEDIVIIDESKEKPCRLSLVPKTLKGPRLIAVEPVAMQYAQQYLASILIRSMSASSLTSHIDFHNQEINRSLAKKGSIDGSIATIDLSEASDRISLSLVNEVFASDPELLRAMLAFRSRYCQLPSDKYLKGERNLPLKKYSTSGSALTFPVETLVFLYSIAVCGS